MRDKNNMVAHYEEGTSDKVYMACVRKLGGSQWQVVGKWGRRGKSLSSSIKGTYGNEMNARAAQCELFREKTDKGYVDIDSGKYSGSVDRSTPCIAENLEKEVAGLEEEREPAEKTAKPAKPEKAESMDGMVALCVDANGLDNHRFDEGIGYVCEGHADPAMMWVYDKFGEKRECFKERFRLVKEE